MIDLNGIEVKRRLIFREWITSRKYSAVTVFFIMAYKYLKMIPYFLEYFVILIACVIIGLFDFSNSIKFLNKSIKLIERRYDDK